MPSADPKTARLTVKGAVCDATNGRLQVSAYQDLRKYYNHEWKVNHPHKEFPGLREGERVPEGVKPWDDALKSKDLSDIGGLNCGWIARVPETNPPKTVWFNTKATGSFRLSFLLAKLQRRIWEDRKASGKSVNASKGAKAVKKEKQSISRTHAAAKRSLDAIKIARKISGIKVVKKAMKASKLKKSAPATKAQKAMKTCKVELKAVKQEPGTTSTGGSELGRRQGNEHGFSSESGTVPCATKGCPFFKTWHLSRCCTGCKTGTHGPWCERLVNPAVKTRKAQYLIRSMSKAKSFTLAGQKRVTRQQIKTRIANKKATRLAQMIEQKSGIEPRAKGFKAAAKKFAKKLHGWRYTSQKTKALAFDKLRIKVEQVDKSVPPPAAPHVKPKKTPKKAAKSVPKKTKKAATKLPLRSAEEQRQRSKFFFQLKVQERRRAAAADAAAAEAGAAAVSSVASPTKRRPLPGKPGTQQRRSALFFEKKERERLLAVAEAKKNVAVTSTAAPVKRRLPMLTSAWRPKLQRRAAKPAETASRSKSIPATSGRCQINEDAPPGHPAYTGIRFFAFRDTYTIKSEDVYGVAKGRKEPKLMQVSVRKAGGCQESAARVARLVFVRLAEGASWNEARALRDSLLARCCGEGQKKALGVVGRATSAYAQNRRKIKALAAAGKPASAKTKNAAAVKAPATVGKTTSAYASRTKQFAAWKAGSKTSAHAQRRRKVPAVKDERMFPPTAAASADALVAVQEMAAQEFEALLSMPHN